MKVHSYAVTYDMFSWSLARQNGTSGPDYFGGTSANDVYHGGAGNDWLLGSAGKDRLYGDAGDDHIEGGSGNDTLHGGAGADFITGTDGDDRIFGDAGNDWLDPYYGRDVVTGGSGSDTFVMHDADLLQVKVIADFHAKGRDHDYIELSLTASDQETFQELKERMTERHGNVYFHYGDDDVAVLKHLQIEDLNGHDFLV